MLNRPVRTRMPGGVGGGIREDSSYPDWVADAFGCLWDSRKIRKLLLVKTKN